MIRVKRGYVCAVCCLVAMVAIGACGGDNNGDGNNGPTYDGGGLQWGDPVGQQDAGTSIDVSAPWSDSDQGLAADDGASSQTDQNAVEDAGGPDPRYSQTLWFPHVADPGQHKQDTEFAIINTSSHEMNGELVAYDENGVELARAATVLNKHGRKELLISADSSPFYTERPIAYMRFNHDVEGAVGYLRYVKHENNTRASVPAVSVMPTGSELYVANVASNDSWRTGFSLLNTTNEHKTLTFEFVSKKADGSCGVVSEKTEPLKAGQKKSIMIKDMFGSLQKDICSATIKNAAGVLSYQGFMGNWDNEPADAKSRLYATSRVGSEKSTTIYVAHVDLAGKWWGAISLFDPSLSPTNSLTFTAYDGAGKQLATKSGHPMSGKLVSTISDLIDKEVIPAGAASLEIKSDHALVGLQGYGATGDVDSSLIMYNTTQTKKTFGVFGVVDDGDGDGAALGYSLFNPNPGSSTVRLELWKDAGGSPIETEIAIIPAWGTIVEMARDRFSDAAEGTYITFRASRAVVGLAVNSNKLGGQVTQDGTPAL